MSRFVTVKRRYMHPVERGGAGKVVALAALSAFWCAIILPLAGQTAVRSPRRAGASGVSGAAEPGRRDPGARIAGWTLRFDEEFDGNRLDFGKWSPHAPGTLLLDGSQDWSPEAIQVWGGQAHITAKMTQSGYISGILTTFGTFARTYGRADIRFRVPAGHGLEPEFRLLPVAPGEFPSVDVLDVAGSDPSTALFANRWKDARAEREYTGSAKVTDLSAGFHIASLEWDEEKLVWNVDGGERFHSFDGVPHQPMYLAVYLAVGGKAGEPDGQTRFPAVFDIDYIRVYSRP